MLLKVCIGLMQPGTQPGDCTAPSITDCLLSTALAVPLLMQHPCCQGNSPVGSRKQAEPGLSSLLQQPPEQQRGQCASIAQAAVPESEQVSASSFTETTAFHGKQLTNSPGHPAAPAAVSQSGWWFPAAQAHVAWRNLPSLLPFAH